jgi:uncharacterized phiE125 gp8 family phage protein
VQYRSLVRQTQPAVEPVTLAEAKAHLRVDTADDDTYITGLVRAAREWVEQYLDRTLVHTQWVMRFDKFPPDGTLDIELPRPPMVASGTATAVALTFTYENGDTATYSTASFRVDRASTPGAVKTNYGQTWPPHRQDDNAISVTWWAGYGPSGSDVPQGVKNAMLLYVHELYEKRGNAEPPEAAKALLDAYRWGSYR